MIKIKLRGFIYYVNKNNIKCLDIDKIYTDEYGLRLKSDFIINTKENKIIKCRNTVEEIIDKFLKEQDE